MKKLTKLTDEQKSAIPAHVKKWIAKGLSTEPTDFAKFEIAVRECYKFANLNPDVPIIRVSNPFVGAFAAAIAMEIIKKHEISSVVGSVVDSEVYSVVDSEVYSAVYSEVDSEVDSEVGSEVYSAVRSAVGSKEIKWHNWLGGKLWCAWQAYVDFYLSVCKLELS